MREYTHEDSYVGRVQEEEVDKLRSVKRKRIKSSEPLAFVRVTEDVEKRLFIAMPDISTEVETPNVPEGGPSNSEIKNIRVAEKRDFELENCKLNAAIKEDQKETVEVKTLGSGVLKGRAQNPFARNAQVVEEVNFKGLMASQLLK